MTKYILERLLAGFVSLFVLVTLSFFLMRAIPGGPFSNTEEKNVSEKVMEQIHDLYGLNDPLHIQYVRYLKNLMQGDLGISYKKLDTSVNELIVRGFPISARVGVWAVALAAATGVPLGIISAVKRRTALDGAAMIIATAGVSVPSFVLCALLMYLFCEKLRILPSFGLTSWKHYILPVFCMAFGQISYITRLMRSSMLEVMRQDYIRTERSKGVPELVVIGKYAVKNSILPIVTYLGPMVAALLTGTFIIEKLFSIPGLGRYFVNAVSDRDYSVVLGLTLFLGMVITICNLIVDILYVLIDPRVKISGEGS